MERLNAGCESNEENGKNLWNAKVRQGGAWRSPYLMVAGERLRYAPSTGRSRGECLQQQ